MQIAATSEAGVTEGAARVARVLLQEGPTTASALAESLGLTPQAVRRQLDQLLDGGLIRADERPPFGPSPTRGRGRPPRVYFLTEAGRGVFEKSYDDLAVTALRFMAQQGGESQIEAFAQHLAGQFEQRYTGSDLDSLAEQMTADGYAATVVRAGDNEPVQLCQHHCPVGHVAAEFPHLCDAEAQAISRVLGRHVIRLATIAHGDGVCTSVIVPTTRPQLAQSDTTERQPDDLID